MRYGTYIFDFGQVIGEFEKYDIVKNPRWKKVGEVCVRTLRDCMQSFFEDGPKRDRRLWLGDMRLQALVNYDTFKNKKTYKASDLVKKLMACEYEYSEPELVNYKKLGDYKYFVMKLRPQDSKDFEQLIPELVYFKFV